MLREWVNNKSPETARVCSPAILPATDQHINLFWAGCMPVAETIAS